MSRDYRRGHTHLLTLTSARAVLYKVLTARETAIRPTQSSKRVILLSILRVFVPIAVAGVSLVINNSAFAANCPAGSPYAAAPATLEACGMRISPLRSVTTLPGGGKEYVYEEPTGTAFSMVTPPASFDASKASASELAMYGVPPEPPANSPEYSLWKAMITQGIKFVTPPPFLAEAPQTSTPTTPDSPATPNLISTSHLGSEQPTGAQPSANTVESNTKIWSGYFDWNGKGNFTHATGYFIEPKTTSACEKPIVAEHSGSYIWAGIGGWGGNKDLGQDGTAQHVEGLGEDETWYEILPAQLHPKGMVLKATPGKYFEADTHYESGEYKFYMYNFAIGEATYGHGTGPVDANVNDFIVERPGKYNLLDVGSVTAQGFTNNKAFGENETERLEMKNRLGEVNAAPTAVLHKYEFDDRYKDCNGLGEEEGKGASSSEGALPVVTTESASAISEVGATLQGSVNPEGSSTNYHFEYGREAGAYEASTPEVEAGEGSESIHANSTITGLQPDTTYHYRIIANSTTGIAAGEERTFKTTGSPPPPPPTVTTLAATGVTAVSAVLEATVNPNGGDTHYYFEYGTDAMLFDQAVPEPPGSDAGSGTSAIQEKVSLSELTPSTTYYYRVVASNSTGTSYGEEKQFTTPPAWTIQTTITPPGEPTDARLQGVSCWSSVGCDAVGVYNNTEGKGIALVENWSGTSWEVQPTESHAKSTQNVLESVSCRSAMECMATGYYEEKGGYHRTLAERWNGSAWTVETTPTEGNTANLASVACPAADECMAVGSYISGSPARYHALTELWNGTEWKVKSSAKLPEEDYNVVFEAVSCPASKACTAVGHLVNKTNGEEALVESWNGTEWTVQSTPTPPHSSDPYLRGVSCWSTSGCVAVGSYKNTEAGGEVKNTELHGREALVERWNGTSWELQESPSPIGKPKPEGEARWELSRVSCSSASWCVATGYYIQSESGAPSLLLGERWKGSAWELELPVNVAGAELSNLEGVSCTAPYECTAVGDWLETSVKSPRTLAERLELP